MLFTILYVRAPKYVSPLPFRHLKHSGYARMPYAVASANEQQNPRGLSERFFDPWLMSLEECFSLKSEMSSKTQDLQIN